LTGERQATRIRSLYLKSVLRQEIAFFDVEMKTGQVVSRMSGDTILVQDAIGEKVNSSHYKNEECRSKLSVDYDQLISKLHNLTLTKLFRSASSNNSLLPS
jgi:ABC-type multidrug transport system fused ATPase/permease subunit